MAAYKPGPNIEFFHHIPRVVGTNQPPVGVLVSGDVASAREYLAGVVAMTIGLAALGIVLAIVLGAVQCCACCNRCCFKHCNAFRQGACRQLMLILLLAFSVAFCGIGYGAAAPVSTIAKGFQDTLNGLIAGADKFVEMANEAAELPTAASNLAISAANVADQVGSANATLAGLADEIRQAAISVSSGDFTGAFSGLDNVTAPLRDASSSLKGFEQYTSVIPVASAAVFGSVVLLLLITLIPLGFCKQAHYCMSTLVSIIFVLIWVVCGALLTAGALVSDICVDPNGIVVQATANVGGELVGDTVRFYLTCDPTRGPSGGVNASNTPLGLAQTGIAAIDALNSSFNELSNAAKDYPQASQAVHYLSHNYTNLQKEVNDVVEVVGCASISSVWVGVINPICNTMVGEGIIVFWALLIAAAAILTIVLCINIVPCTLHPAKYSHDHAHHGFGRGAATVSTPNPILSDPSAARVVGQPPGFELRKF